MVLDEVETWALRGTVWCNDCVGDQNVRRVGILKGSTMVLDEDYGPGWTKKDREVSRIRDCLQDAMWDVKRCSRVVHDIARTYKQAKKALERAENRLKKRARELIVLMPDEEKKIRQEIMLMLGSDEFVTQSTLSEPSVD